MIRDIVENCSRAGLSLPSYLVKTISCLIITRLFLLFCVSNTRSVQISNVLLNRPELKVPSSISPDRLAELADAGLLPWLGVPFLQGLTPSQLLAALPALGSVSFSPAQVQKEHKGLNNVERKI